MRNYNKLTGSVIVMALVFALSGCPGGGGGGGDDPIAISSFQVDGYRDEFLLGENFTLQNLVLNVVFDDGEVKTYTEADLPDGFSLNLSGYNKNAVGTYKVILQYKGFDLPLELTVTVIDPDATMQKPKATPSGGTFTDGDTVTLVYGTDGAEIRYTVNGAAPASITDGTKYTAPIPLSGTGMQVIRARAFDTIKSRVSSALLTAWYTSAEGAKAVFVGGQSSALTAGTAGAIEIPVFTIGIDADKTGTIAWYTDPEGTEEGGIPVYINPEVAPVSAFGGGTVSFTANRLGGMSVAGTYYYRVTYDGTESDVGSLVISPATGGDITVSAISSNLSLEEGYLPGYSLAVSAVVDGGGTLSYQWYSSTEFVVYAWASTLLEGETDESLSILPGLAAATDSDPQIYYYFCLVSAEGSKTEISAMTRVYVYPRRSIVSVVEKSGRIISGTSSRIQYTVTTTGFPDVNQPHPIKIENLPIGIRMDNIQSYGLMLEGNTGTLELQGMTTSSTPPTPPEGGVYSNLRLIIDGTGDIPDTESPFFDLTVLELKVGTQIGSLSTSSCTVELPITARGFADGTYDVVLPASPIPYYNLTAPPTLDIADEIGLLTLTSSGVTGATIPDVINTIYFTLGTAPDDVRTPNFPVYLTQPGTTRVSGITIYPAGDVTVVEGNTANLTADVTPIDAGNKNVTWSSSNPAIAAVNNDGTVVGVSAGSVSIRATATDGSKIYSLKAVTVQAAPVLVNSITISPASLTVAEGANANLAATVLPADADNRTVTWSSSNSAIATVNNSGRVSGVARGTATITAAANDGSGWSASCKVTVAGPAPTGISFSKDIIYTWYGKEEDLGMNVSPANADRDNITFTWSSDDNWSYTGNLRSREGTGRASTTVSEASGNMADRKTKITLTATLPNGESASIEFRTRFTMKASIYYDDDPRYVYGIWFNSGQSYSWQRSTPERYVRAYYPADELEWRYEQTSYPNAYLTKIPRTEYTISSRDPDITVSAHPSEPNTYVLTRTSASVFKMVTLDIIAGSGNYAERYTQVINLVD